MARNLRLVYVIILFVLGLVACSYDKSVLSEEQIRDLAWQALDPYIASHNRNAWEVIEIKKVIGNDIIGQFKDEINYGCFINATLIPENKINPNQVYWYVHMEPRPATPLPPKLNEPVGTGNPPIIPEPWAAHALFLIDPINGQILSRRLGCIVP